MSDVADFSSSNIIEQIITEINELEDIFLHCKSFFPALNNELIGNKSFEAPTYYRSTQ